MSLQLIPRADSAYEPQLLLKGLLTNLDTHYGAQEIIYANHHRLTYKSFHDRVVRLFNVLSSMGVSSGDTVAVLDWDSHRYLECFFAIPMLGAVLHTVNIRLSPEQILYTMNHASDNVVLIHEDFLPMAEKIAGRLRL